MAWLGMVKVKRVMAETTKTAIAPMRLTVLRTKDFFMVTESLKRASMNRTSGSFCALANIRALHEVGSSLNAPACPKTQQNVPFACLLNFLTLGEPAAVEAQCAAILE